MAADSHSQMPLKGAILCCTSIGPEERNRLAAVAQEMGAEHKYDLTSDVTHLLIGAIDTPKYKYVAKERPDVKVLKPGWVDAVRQEWIAGEDVNVTALENEWRAPPFFGLKICLTGFEDLKERNAISSTVQEHGAQYSGDLTRDITQLIAAVPRGKKYEHARSWNVKVVAIEWIQDSIERGLALDEALYDPMLPADQRGLHAWRRAALQPVVGKRPRQDNQQGPIGDRKRKLRRTASEKFGSQNEAIWADITSGTSEQKAEDAWDEQKDDDSRAFHSEIDRYAIAAVNPPGSTRSLNQAPEENTHPGIPNPKPRGIFQQRLVCLLGFDDMKTKILRETLDSHGAIVVLEEDIEAIALDRRAEGFLVVPHNVPEANLPPLRHLQMCQVTEFWVECCLEQKSLLDPDSAILCKPLPHCKVDGFQGVSVSSTSFSGLDLLHLGKVVNLVGATYSEYLNASTSVLVSKLEHPDKIEKIKFAVQNGVPAVSVAWLEACLEKGIIQEPRKYILTSVHENTLGYDEDPTIRRAGQGEERKTRAAEPQLGKNAVNRDPKPRKSGFREPRALPLDDDISGEDVAHQLTKPTVPLQELAPEVNSANRKSQSYSSKSNSLSPSKEPSMAESEEATNLEDSENALPPEDPGEVTPKPVLEPPPEPEPDDTARIDSAISALLAQKQASRSSSLARQTGASAGESKGNATKTRRNRRVLGRVSSTASTGSNPLSRASSIDQSQSRNGNLAPGPATQALQQSNFQPSQALVWQDPDVQREREDLIGRMGGKVEQNACLTVEDGKVLRDAASDGGGVGTRVRRRAREGRAGATVGGDL